MTYALRFFLQAGLVACLTAFASISSPGQETSSAQVAPPVRRVSAVQGRISVIPNANLRQVMISIDSPLQLSPTSKQIVFLVRGDFTHYPYAWAGNGRVLTSDDTLIVSPEGNESPAPILAFAFSGSTTPETLKDWKMDRFQVFQIARYGEVTPLAPDQMLQLSTTGTYTRSQAAILEPFSLTPLSPSTGTSALTPKPSGVGPAPICQAGGPGSTGCSAGGCSVTCGPGSHSCCSGGVCSCLPGPGH